MNKLLKVLAVSSMLVLSACANNKASDQTKTSTKEVKKTEAPLKDFANKMKEDGAKIKFVFWPNVKKAKDSVRKTLDPKQDKSKMLIEKSAEFFTSLDAKETSDKPVLPQTDVVNAYELSNKDETFNVSIFKEGYVKWQNFKSNEKQIFKITKDDLAKLKAISDAFQAK